MKSTLPCGRKRPKLEERSATDSAAAARLQDFLKTQGLRATAQREKISEIALNQKSHFEIQTLIKEVQNHYPEISPATVYRSVKTLCEAGLLNETLQSNTGVTLYEAHDEEHHDHIVCIDCGEIFEFHDENLESAQARVLKSLDFEAVRHKHVIYAKCALLSQVNKPLSKK